MTWSAPEYLALLLLVPVAIGIGILAFRARRRVLGALAGEGTREGLFPPAASRARGWQAVLAAVAVAGMAVASAGPRLGFHWQQRHVEGVAIVAILDVSRSMDAADVSPSRMERARRELRDLLGLLRGDTVGLVSFAAGAFKSIPLTADYDTVAWAIDQSSTELIRAQGTAMAGALDAALDLLGPAGGAGKAIVVLSDGELHDDDAELDAAAQRCREAGVHVFALGIGDPAGAPIPMADGGFKKDRAGQVVVTRLDEGRLRALAEATGGAYVRAVPSDDDVRALYIDEIRGRLETAERGVHREKSWHERYQWPLAAALAAMAIGSALGIRRGRPQVRGMAAVSMALLALAPAHAYAGAREDGLGAWKAGRYGEAVEKLGQARVEAPADVEVGHALAESLYRTGRFREAEQVFEALAAADAEGRARHLHNAGNAAYRAGRLEDALADFQRAAEASPELEPAKGNAAAVQKEIAARLQQQEQQQEQQPQEQGGQEGEPQGEGQASPEEGKPPEDGSETQPGQAPPQDDGTMEEAPRASDAQPSPGEGQDSGDASADAAGLEGSTPEGADVARPAAPGRMSKEDASRVLDAVKDGTPRVAVGGRDAEKDW
jgi:Ca-activated chloride channel family protein